MQGVGIGGTPSGATSLLFDTGNNDKIITDPTYWGPLAAALEPGRSPDVAIDVQLDKAGVKPSDINYVILGHMHLDHAGNVGKFPTATIVYQRDEIVNAFWPKPGFGCCYITGDFAMLRNDVGVNQVSRQKVIELNGDLDLFGDGSVYIHRAVSHTPGSQMVVVRLPKTGPVVRKSRPVLVPRHETHGFLIILDSAIGTKPRRGTRSLSPASSAAESVSALRASGRIIPMSRPASATSPNC
jgi:N-acyl homoserine lactone hydrolase